MTSPHQSTSHRHVLSAIVLCAFLLVSLVGVSQAEARQEGSVALKARPGFDGYCKEERWLPIHVEVENTGVDLNAEVRVSSKSNGQERSLTSMNVELPATSRKAFFLYAYLPNGYSRQLNVSVLARGKVLKKITLSINCLSFAENRIIGVLADTPSTYDTLNDVKPLQGFVRVAQLEISDLPDRAQGWAALDALVISNVDTGTFTPEQKQALNSWVAAGGKLLVVGGANWQGTGAGLKDILPVDLTTTSRVSSLSQLQNYVRDQAPLDSEVILAKGKVRPQSQVLVQQDGIPLLVERQTGFGSVYFFAADPALQPLSDWPGMKEVYEHLLDSTSQLPTWADGNWYDYRANQALATIPELGFPSIFYICGLLGFYILIIGPLNYFVLRRIRRRELAWVTIPVLVGIFTCVAYGTGFSYRGVTPILNRLAVAQAWDGVDQAQVRALVGIYSPLRTKYDLEARDGFMFQPFRPGDMGLDTSANWSTQLEGSTMVVPDVSLEIGAMKTVVAQGSLPALDIRHDLVLKISSLNPLLTGNITNKSSYTIEDAILVTSGDWTRLGDLVPGQTKKVNVSVAPGSNGPEFYGLNSMQVMNINYSTVQTDEKAARRSALFDTVFMTDYGVNQGNWGVYLIGWVNDRELPTGLRDRKFKAFDTMLYIDMLSPTMQIEPKEVRLPISLFAWQASDANISPYYARDLPPNGYVLRFQPAFRIQPDKVTSVGFYIASNASLQELVVSAWDYELKTWVRIPLTGSYSRIPEPNRYVGPDGEIRIKIVSRRSDWTEINAAHISVTVGP